MNTLIQTYSHGIESCAEVLLISRVSGVLHQLLQAQTDKKYRLTVKIVHAWVNAATHTHTHTCTNIPVTADGI